MLETTGTVFSAAKATWEIVSGIASRRAAKKVAERLRLVRDTMLAAQRGNPAPRAFSEEAIAWAARVPPADVQDLVYRLKREGFIVPAPFGGYWLRERAGIPSPHRLFG